MEQENFSQALEKRYRLVQEKFDTVFGSAEVTIDIQIHDQLLDTTVLMKHLLKSCTGDDAIDDELCRMTADVLERKLDGLERYINRMIGSDVNNG